MFLEMVILFVVSAVIFMLFDRPLYRTVTALVKSTQQFTNAMDRKWSGRIFVGFLALLSIGGFTYFVIMPLKEYMNRFSVRELGVFPPASDMITLIIVQIVFSLLVIMLLLMLTRKKAKAYGMAMAILLGVLTLGCVWGVAIPKTGGVTLVTPRSSIAETLLVMRHPKLNVLPPIFASREQITRRVRETVLKSKEVLYLIWSDPVVLREGPLSFDYQIIRYGYNGDADSIESDTAIFHQSNQSVEEFINEFRDTIFVHLGLDAPEDDLSIVVSKDIRSFRHLVQGIEKYNQYTKEGLDSALLHFDIAIEYDPCYALAYVYKAYCYGILTDRKWQASRDSVGYGQPSQKLPYLPFADTLSYYLHVADSVSQAPTCFGGNQTDLTDHFLVTRTEALLYQVYARVYLDYYMGHKQQHSALGRVSLDLASKFSQRAQQSYVKAIEKNPKAYKVKNNLSTVYSDLSKIDLLHGDTISAHRNLMLADRAIDEAMEIDRLDQGYFVNKGSYLILQYKICIPRDTMLLVQAEELIRRGINNTERAFWKGYGYYNLACIAVLRGNIKVAMNYLCDAVKTGALNVREEARYDEDLEELRMELGSRFEEFFDACRDDQGDGSKEVYVPNPGMISTEYALR